MNSKLKIGIVLDDSLDTPDGVQQYVLTIGQWLSSNGHDIHYLVGETHRTDVTNIHSLARNFKVRFNGNRLTLPLPTSTKKLQNFLNTHQFDVLHIQVPYSPLLAHKIIKLAPDHTAIFGTFHVLPYSKTVQAANRALAISLRSTLKMFDKIFTVSLAAQDFAKRVYKVDSEVLPNVTDVGRFAAAGKKVVAKNQQVTIVFLGRLVPRKGCLILLKALKELKLKNLSHNYRVRIGGKGPLADMLKDYVEKNSLSARVSFEGFIAEDKKPDFLASADIAVFPSSAGESFGIVLIEAMAAGHAVVLAGDNPGYRSVMGDRPDLIFPAKNEKILSEKLATFIEDAGLRKETTFWQSEYVKQFDINVVGKKLVNAYQASCLARRKQG